MNKLLLSYALAAGGVLAQASTSSPNGSSSSGTAPTITAQPASAVATTGSSASFIVAATGTPAPTYQWLFDGAPIRGATSATYTISSATLQDAGLYSVSVRNSAGQVTSQAAAFSVATAAAGLTAAPQSQTLNAGGGTTLSVSASGSGLTYQWKFNDQDIPGATSSSLALTDAGALDSGTYSVEISSGGALVGVGVAQIEVSFDARLANLSVRGSVGKGQQQLIVGFTIAGTGTKSILLRGVGPTLSTFGVTDPLAAPELTLYGPDGKTLATNTAWGGGAELSAVFTQVGAFALPADSLDAALLETLSPGSYSAWVTGVNMATGEAMAEIYDADTGTPTASLVNESGRAYVTASNILTAGFVVSGTTAETVLVRGIGPTLATFGIVPALAATTVTVYDASGNPIAADTGWNNDPRLAACAAQVGAFALPAPSKDSAVLVTLEPGAYTAQVTGANGSTGAGMVEIYEVR